MLGYLWYLGTPYRNYPAGLEAAYEEASRIAGVLISNGVNVFCPIAYGHPLNKYTNLAREEWLTHDFIFMQRCNGIIVAEMDNWEKSLGLAIEIRYFRTLSGQPSQRPPKTFRPRIQLNPTDIWPAIKKIKAIEYD